MWVVDDEDNILEALDKSMEHTELHMIMLRWFESKGKTPKDVIAFLTATWVGQMCLNGYSEEFTDETLKRMKKTWENHRFNQRNR